MWNVGLIKLGAVMRDDQYVLNHCTPFLARRNTDPRHDFGFGHYEAGDQRATIREAWRFPVIDTCSTPPTGCDAADYNDVTFIYSAPVDPPAEVAVTGTFSRLYEPLPLRRVMFLGAPTAYFAHTAPVPRRGVFYYQFQVDGDFTVDPINPQRVLLDNGLQWSRFFTWECAFPVVLQRWQLGVLERFCDHILPFRTRDGQRFLSWYYDGLDQSAREGVIRSAYRLDDSAGAANYIDKILAREESHHLVDYAACLGQVSRILRQRDPNHEPPQASRELYVSLYEEMAGNDVTGWDYAAYGSPRYFLDLLRRHAFTGAFSHPKYGGNLSASGWAYLQSRVPFDWRRSLERPWGTSDHYRG